MHIAKKKIDFGSRNPKWVKLVDIKIYYFNSRIIKMVEYLCEDCGHVFTQKSHYNSHKQRKNPCSKNSKLDKIIEKKVKEVLERETTNNMYNSIIPISTNSTSQICITKPFLKWVGGKTQIITDVLSLFPTNMKNYYEPFLGGGSVLLGLLSYIKSGKITISEKIYASDLNYNLICLYKNIQSQPNALIAEVKKITDDFSKIKGTEVNRKASNIEEANTSQESYYFWIRGKFNALTKEEKKNPVASAMLLFMNKTCFRGVYREGPNGFNVPFGNYKNPSILEEEHIKSISDLIKDVIFTTNSFNESLKNIESGDFVYLDPPYAPESDKSFVSYTSDGFSLENHKSLFKICNNMISQNIKFLMSNADVKLVKDSFPLPNYKTKIISCRRAINSKKPESKTNEVLITN